jgi:hypothetical protein
VAGDDHRNGQTSERVKRFGTIGHYNDGSTARNNAARTLTPRKGYHRIDEITALISCNAVVETVRRGKPITSRGPGHADTTIRITKMRVTRAVALTPKISVKLGV